MLFWGNLMKELINVAVNCIEIFHLLLLDVVKEFPDIR